jgi:predicted RNA binding protein YcfA (HicA-like mRNA interferase family)
MVMKVKEVIALLEEYGWHYVRTRGDHHIYAKDGEKRLIVVPGKPNDDLREGTLMSILRGAGLSEKKYYLRYGHTKGNN